MSHVNYQGLGLRSFNACQYHNPSFFVWYYGIGTLNRPQHDVGSYFVGDSRRPTFRPRGSHLLSLRGLHIPSVLKKPPRAPVLWVLGVGYVTIS